MDFRKLDHDVARALTNHRDHRGHRGKGYGRGPRACEAQAGQGPPAPVWQYVLPAAGDPFDHAPFRALVLSREKPDELVEKAGYRGEAARRRYAMIRFGSPSSIRVTVVIDESAAGEVDLYVDADRNLRVEDRDRVNGKAGETKSVEDAGHGRYRWTSRLVENETCNGPIPRAVVFRLGASGQTLGYAGGISRRERSWWGEQWRSTRARGRASWAGETRLDW